MVAPPTYSDDAYVDPDVLGPADEAPQPPAFVSTYICFECCREFTTTRAIRMHELRAHNADANYPVALRGQTACPGCHKEFW
eukprot:4117262-Alexandrium_andersonii.AAC.1